MVQNPSLPVEARAIAKEAYIYGYPMVQAYLTMYDLPEQLLVKNPISRYLINSPMLPDLNLDSEGGLTIDIQSDSPGKDKESNWLPGRRSCSPCAITCPNLSSFKGLGSLHPWSG
jgi:hypothetical protein